MAAEASGFFNAEYDADSDFWDRVYTADQFADYFGHLVSNGVFEGDLQVRQHSDTSTAMDVRVRPGKAMINGYWYNLQEDVYFNVDVNTASNVRTDCVCLRYNFSDRAINVVYHKDTNTPVRNGEMYELMLATISVGSNVTSISQSSITDTRSSSAVCGIVTGLIDQIDFDEAYAQFTVWFDEYKQSIIDDFSEAGELAQEIFNAWFEHMKGQLSTDAAGNLQLEIDDLADTVAEAFSPAKLYNVGEYVTYRNRLYRCKRTVTSYGNFDAHDWTFIRVLDAVKFDANVGENCTTIFNSDGSITQTYLDRIQKISFREDGSIYEVFSKPNGTNYGTKLTVFNEDGSITETVTKY